MVASTLVEIPSSRNLATLSELARLESLNIRDPLKFCGTTSMDPRVRGDDKEEG